MSVPARTPTDYAAYIHNARKLRAQALAALFADLRQSLRSALRTSGRTRASHAR